jgi:hypothetical protein
MATTNRKRVRVRKVHTALVGGSLACAAFHETPSLGKSMAICSYDHFKPGGLSRRGNLEMTATSSALGAAASGIPESVGLLGIWQVRLGELLIRKSVEERSRERLSELLRISAPSGLV